MLNKFFIQENHFSTNWKCLHFLDNQSIFELIDCKIFNIPEKCSFWIQLFDVSGSFVLNDVEKKVNECLVIITVLLSFKNYLVIVYFVPLGKYLCGTNHWFDWFENAFQKYYHLRFEKIEIFPINFDNIKPLNILINVRKFEKYLRKSS